LWNPVTNSPWYEFINGTYETDDPEAIAKLRELGFSEKPIDPKIQAALAITADLTMPQPKPPPRYQDVPAAEPRPKVAEPKPVESKPAEPIVVVEAPPKKDVPGELGKMIPKPIVRGKTRAAPKARKE
jgi:hypothetical protein